MVALWGVHKLYVILFVTGCSYGFVFEGSKMTPELETFTLSELDLPIKIFCNKSKAPHNMEYIVWQYKRCGLGLSVTDCEEVSANEEWQMVQCRNKTKLCTGATLHIPYPSEADSGLYRCVMKLSKTTKFRIHRIVQLEVYDKRAKSIEIIPEVMDNQTVLEKESARLLCRVRSVSYPHFLWTRSKVSQVADAAGNVNSEVEMLGNGETSRGSKKSFTSKLILPNVSRDDSGFYTCFVVNDRQQASKQIVLNVISQGREMSHTRYEILWVGVVLAVSAKSCLLVVWFLLQRRHKNSKLVSESEEDVSDDPSSLLTSALSA